MKVKIEQVTRYKITIGDKVYEDFRRSDDWEGMLKYSGPSGAVIVQMPGDMEASFLSIYGEQNTEAIMQSLFRSIRVKMSADYEE